MSGLGSGKRSFEVACIYPLKKEVTAVWAWAGVKDKRETTDPELVEHRWDIDRAKDRAGVVSSRALLRTLAEMSGCGHDITCNSN